MNPVLHVVAIVSLCVAVLCALLIALDIVAGNRQKMWIMNLVWPITALYSGPLGLWSYYTVGRLSTRKMLHDMKSHNGNAAKRKPRWQAVGLAAMHCGSGCTLGDITAEWFIFAVPFTVFGMELFGAWVLDYVAAFAFGIAFQYFTIKPMKELSPKAGLLAALKADALSLTAWQIGMYGWMAIAVFLIFGRELEQTDPVFWFMMQIAMLAGFLTSYPVNWWLLRAGIKEEM